MPAQNKTLHHTQCDSNTYIEFKVEVNCYFNSFNTVSLLHTPSHIFVIVHLFHVKFLPVATLPQATKDTSPTQLTSSML